MTKLSLYLATLLLGSNFSASTLPKDPPTAAYSSATMTPTEQRVVDLANAERWHRDMGVLTPNPLLVEVAREHSKEMCEKAYFDHISPTPGYKTPMDRYLKGLGHTPTYACLGENLFFCTVVDVDRGHKCLMESTKHRENILNPTFQETGVGVYVDQAGRFWVTQLFLTQAG